MKILKIIPALLLLSFLSIKTNAQFQDIGEQHNQLLTDLNLTPKSLIGINSTSALQMIKGKIPNVPKSITPAIVDQTVKYFGDIFNGGTTNSVNLSSHMHNSLLGLMKSISQIDINTNEQLNDEVVNAFNNKVDEWYQTARIMKEITETEKNQLEAFYSTAKKSPIYWQGFIKNNNLESSSMIVFSNNSYKFRFWHWLGVAIMDAGGALIGAASGPIGSVVLGAAGSAVAHLIDP